MKNNLFSKVKWYAIGIIIIAIMLSVSLSFCSWDTMSVKTALSKGNSGWYNNSVQKYLLEEDKNNNYIVDVGDIVSFGKYYQDSNATNKSPIRWIVVDKINNQLTLLAEKVMAFGSFWGNYYYNGSEWVWSTQANGLYYQNYSKSTLRAWLNSYYGGGDARNDGGTAFSSNSSEPRFKGFMAEAFTPDEQAYIVNKTMSGMKGYGKDNIPSTPTDSYAEIKDKVWVPSWSEVYGTTETPWGITIDGSPNSRFSYFSDTKSGSANHNLIGKTTAFASTPDISNFTYTNTSDIANAQGVSANSNVWWWLRSPYAASFEGALVVDSGGGGARTDTHISRGGVRPAIIIPV